MAIVMDDQPFNLQKSQVIIILIQVVTGAEAALRDANARKMARTSVHKTKYHSLNHIICHGKVT